MNTLAMIELRTVNWFGHRLFMEIRPGEDKGILENQAVQTFRDLVIAMKSQTVSALDTRGAQLIKQN